MADMIIHATYRWREKLSTQVYYCAPHDFSMCPPFVTRQTWSRQSISAHNRCSIHIRFVKIQRWFFFAAQADSVVEAVERHPNMFP